jgi:hypothetical protein
MKKQKSRCSSAFQAERTACSYFFFLTVFFFAAFLAFFFAGIEAPPLIDDE